MKRLFFMVTLLVLLTAACVPQAQPTQESVLPVGDGGDVTPIPSPTHIPVDITPAQRAALSALTKTVGLTADKITIVSTEAVVWPDSCLGVMRAGMMCAQAKVQGYKIVLKADGKQYELHTNQNGSVVVFATDKLALDKAVDEVTAQLAQNLGLRKKDISVVSTANMEFADACLGVDMPDVMCAQMVTPGQIIVLEANGIQYEYHTTADAARIQPATLALTWKREGGIAGFCDNMTVFLSGEVYVSNCKGQPDGKMKTFDSLFSAQQMKEFDNWVSTFGQMSLDSSDPEGVSDRMVRTMTLYGRGESQPSEDDKAAMFRWADDLFQKLSG